MFRVLIIILVLISAVTASIAQEPKAPQTDCKEKREISPTNYWFWQAYPGVVDVAQADGKLTGRLDHGGRSLCFSLDLKMLEDKDSKLLGYKKAVGELYRLQRASEEVLEYYKWDQRDKAIIASLEAEIKTIDQRIKALIGVDIPAENGFVEWWKNNEDYMYLSDDGTRLLLDTEAKQAAKPIQDTNPEREVTAADYWWLSSEPEYKQTKETEYYIHGELTRDHFLEKIRVEKSKLNDLGIKEQVYKTKLSDEILYFKNAPDAKQLSYLQFANARLKNITGLSFADGQLWINWWEKNKDKLKLRKDGSILIVIN